jgi:hypothetical protein
MKSHPSNLTPGRHTLPILRVFAEFSRCITERRQLAGRQRYKGGAHPGGGQEAKRIVRVSPCICSTTEGLLPCVGLLKLAAQN